MVAVMEMAQMILIVPKTSLKKRVSFIIGRLAPPQNRLSKNAGVSKVELKYNQLFRKLYKKFTTARIVPALVVSSKYDATSQLDPGRGCSLRSEPYSLRIYRAKACSIGLSCSSHS